MQPLHYARCTLQNIEVNHLITFQKNFYGINTILNTFDYKQHNKKDNCLISLMDLTQNPNVRLKFWRILEHHFMSI